MILYSPFPSKASSRVDHYCVKMKDYPQIFLIDFSEEGERSFSCLFFFFFFNVLNLKSDIYFCCLATPSSTFAMIILL